MFPNPQIRVVAEQTIEDVRGYWEQPLRQFVASLRVNEVNPNSR